MQESKGVIGVFLCQAFYNSLKSEFLTHHEESRQPYFSIKISKEKKKSFFVNFYHLSPQKI